MPGCQAVGSQGVKVKVLEKVNIPASDIYIRSIMLGLPGPCCPCTASKRTPFCNSPDQPSMVSRTRYKNAPFFLAKCANATQRPPSSHCSYRLDLEVKTYQREDQRLEVLHEIVEDAEAFWVGRVTDVDEGSNLRCLDCASRSQYRCAFIVTHGTAGIAYLKGDVVIPQSNLQLLSPVLVLLRPLAIVFPVSSSAHVHRIVTSHPLLDILQDLAGLDDALDLVNHGRADAHCTRPG